MKKFILLILICVFPITAGSHPGKTDRYGGHKCFKQCEEWILYYSEYHLHDKDGKPIRVNKKPKKTSKKTVLRSAATETVLPALNDAPKSEQTVTIYRYVTTTQENLSSFNPLLWILLVLLLLLLILRMNRKKEN